MEDTLFIFVVFIAWAAIFGGIGYVIGNARGRGAEGFALGVLLGIIGWIITALLSEQGHKCPECLGVVPKEARRCKHCGVEMVKTIAPQSSSSPDGFYVLNGEKTEGPFSKEQLRILVRNGKISGKTLCAREGDATWQPTGTWL